VLERGATPLAALRRIDPEMTLLSPTRLSLLPGMRRRAGDPAYLRFGELVERFDAYRRERGLEVRTGVDVTAVERAGAGFVARWDGGEVAGDRVINATGIISTPNLPPDLVPTTFRSMHSLEVRRHHLEASRRLLVVGAGPSATEVLEGWLAVRRPGDRAWISARGKIRAYPHHILGIDLHYWIWLPEHLAPRWIGGQPPEPMTGRTVVKAIRAGHITRLGGVTRYAPDRVVCGDATVEPDLLVLATGFRYATDHLRATGVDLLGYRPGRTLASPYLRGIARDARELADR
jgi:putative flavoprotein involved in K+ transport